MLGCARNIRVAPIVPGADRHLKRGLLVTESVGEVVAWKSVVSSPSRNYSTPLGGRPLYTGSPKTPNNNVASRAAFCNDQFSGPVIFGTGIQLNSVALGFQHLWAHLIAANDYFHVFIANTGGYPKLCWLYNSASATNTCVGTNDLTTTGDKTIIIQYLGGTVTSTASYRAWLNGVACTLTTGGVFAEGPTHFGSIFSSYTAGGGFFSKADLAMRQSFIAPGSGTVIGAGTVEYMHRYLLGAGAV